MKNENEILLSVRNASRHFGSLAAVDQLSFDVRRGEVLGIAGPNGKGNKYNNNVKKI